MSEKRAEALKHYAAWNNAIHAMLFAEPRPQAPVYLYLEPELLDQAAILAAIETSNSRSDLIDAVRGSLGWDRVDTPFLWHIREADDWFNDGMQAPPPFLALLAVFVLGAEAMVGDTDHAAHNYYDRLLDVFQVDDALGARIRRGFKGTIEFWQLLNDWLVQWDGELGLPTAQVVDRRVNIGYALSQALVSAHDRERLATAFEEYGLRPGRRMAPLEMDQYLAHWLSHAGAPGRLKRLWSNDEARRRITLIACAELEAWSGPAAQLVAERTSGRVPLLWRADLERGALPVIDLFLACQADPSRVSGPYQAIAPTDATGREGLAKASDALVIQQMRGSELCALEPWSELSLAALLAGAFTLERREGQAVTVSRSSNPILVLTYDDRDALWHEVTRAQLLERCIVLVHADVLQKVDPHLQRYARIGFERHQPDTLEGIPPGWTAFLDVVLADAPEDEAAGVLAALSPSRANVVSLEGGLRLGRQTWHADAPPDVTATLVAERRIAASVERRRELDTGPGSCSLGEGVGRVSARIAAAGLGSGDYLVQLHAAGRDGMVLVDEAPFRLRTASHPRPHKSGLSVAPGHVLDDAHGLVNATQPHATAGIIVWGGLIDGDDDANTDAVIPDLPKMLATPAPVPQSPAVSTEQRGAKYAMPCAVLGHHYWIVDRAEPDDTPYTLKHMQCRECQREEWRRSGGRRWGATAARGQPLKRRAPDAPRARLPGVGRTAWPRPTLELMLDALSYIGSGSWAMLREIAQSLDPENPYFAAEAARAYSALGHIDITLDARTRRPATWRMSPPALVETSDGSWVLAGARSDALTEVLLDASEAAVSRQGSEQGLSVIRAIGGTDAISELAERLEGDGHPLVVSERFSARLAPLLPALGDVLIDAEAFRLGSLAVERLDHASRQWIDAGDTRPVGAFRISHHGRLHGVTAPGDPEGVVRIVDMLTSKHLSAAHAGGGFVAFDPASETLSVPIGAELPGLLDRVATLCSGAPAFVRRDDWAIHYPNVPATVAGHLQRCLGL